MHGAVVLFLAAAAAGVAASPTTTGLSMPADANLAEDTASYYLDSVLRFESVPLGTRTLTRSEALAACGQSFARVRWTPYRIELQVPAVVSIPLPASYDGTRIASRLRWWACGNGTHAPADAPGVTWVRAPAAGVYVLGANDCAGGYDCFECTDAGGGCDCRGEMNDAYDVAYTVLVCVLLGVARAIRVWKSGTLAFISLSPRSLLNPHVQVHAIELVAYAVAAAHSIDIALRWGWTETAAVMGTVAACIMALVSLLSFMFPRAHVLSEEGGGRESLEGLWDFMLVAIFCAYTFSGVVVRRPAPMIVAASFVILVVFILLTITSNHKSDSWAMRLLQALSVVGVACYALPFMGTECSNRFV